MEERLADDVVTSNAPAYKPRRSAKDAYRRQLHLDLASKMNTPQPSQEDLARNLFASGNPDAAGNIHASAASALLSTSGLSNAILKGIWERAKRGSAPARSSMMNEAEFVCAHQLSVDAGGVFGLASHASVDLAAETATATATATPAATATATAAATPAVWSSYVLRSDGTVVRTVTGGASCSPKKEETETARIDTV